MLQELIKDLQSTLSNYNQGLAKQNLLVDNPWTMVDGDLNLQRLIFKKDQSLYIVKEGEIQESKWEYLPRVKSLVIEIGGRKILMNEVFADEKALILKKDGSTIEFLAFANQEKLPDLNLIEYFKNLEFHGVPPKDDVSKINTPFFTDTSEKWWFFSVLAIIFFVIVLTINGFFK